MKYKNQVSKVISKLLPGSRQPKVKTRKINIYVNGLYGKFENVEHALDKIKKITQEIKINSTYISEIDPEVHFYVDSFFAFLYSCLDVLAQILSQHYEDLNKLNLDERQISFRQVLNEINKNRLRLPIDNELKNIMLSRYFINLDKYRNCSTHRHQIYIKKEQKTTAETAGYTNTTSTGELPTIQWIICDDPFKFDLESKKPPIKQKRDLYDYSNRMYENIKRKIDNIINLL